MRAETDEWIAQPGQWTQMHRMQGDDMWGGTLPMSEQPGAWPSELRSQPHQQDWARKSDNCQWGHLSTGVAGVAGVMVKQVDSFNGQSSQDSSRRRVSEKPLDIPLLHLHLAYY